MTVQKPSLDEVFLALTGHDTGEADADRRAPARTAPTPDHHSERPGGRAMSTSPTSDPGPTSAPGTGLPTRVSLADTVSQTMTMAWRATLKMRRNFEQFFDVTIQPLLFTAMFAYIFGGAISGSVTDYLPILITGMIAQTVLTACVATGVQLREDMDKGVFDRFRVLPISRIAPLAGPMVADMLRYAIAATLTFATGIVMGYRPGGGVARGLRGHRAGDHRRLVAGLGVHLVRHGRARARRSCRATR